MQDLRFRLVTLGRLALRSPTGDEDPSLARRRLKLAVLAVLAVERRPLARDVLVEMFWGEQEEGRARHSLSDALSHLRRVLGTGAISTREAEVALADAAPLVVDAREFADAVARKEFARALTLYGGPFLDSVYVGASQSFERWVERERARLEALFLKASGAHCAALARARQWDEVGAVAGRWLDVAPTSAEAALFRLNALKAPGTRDSAVAALAEYERLRARLASDFDLVPERAVAELAASIAAQVGASEAPTPAFMAPPEAMGNPPAASTAAPAQAVAVARPPSITLAPPTPEPVEGAGGAAAVDSRATIPEPGPVLEPAARRDRGRRRLAWAALAAVALVLAAVAAVSIWRRRADRVSPTTVAVLPFEVRGDREYAYLQEGMVDLLSMNLDGAGALHAVDPRALLARLARSETAETTRAGRMLAPEEARAVARGFGAGLFVLGDVVGVGGRVRISASLYDARRGWNEAARGVVEGTPAELFALVDQLTRQLLAGSPEQSPDHLTGLAALTTSSLPALKAYLAGASEYRAGHFDAAEASFQRAAILDSTFALAHYQLSNTLLWVARGGWDSVANTGLRAVRHSARLSRRARLLVEAYSAFRTGDLDRAERLYRSVVSSYPDEVEAWYQLGDLMYHGNAPRGRSFVEARPAFARVLEHEPQHLGALLHLLRIALWERRHAEADSLMRRAAALGSTQIRAELDALRAFAMGDAAAQNAAVAALREMPDEAVRVSAMRVALFTGHLDGAERIARMLVAPNRAPEFRAVGRLQLADLALARGRRRAARAELDSAAQDASGIVPTIALEYRALQLAQAFLLVPRAELEAMRDTLQRWDADVEPTRFPMWAVYNGLHGQIRRYLLGVLSVRLGDLDEAERHARALAADTLTATGEARAFAAGLGESVRAHVLAARGASDSALTAFQRGKLVISEGLLDAPVGNQATDRYGRAEMLRSLGRPNEARAWYASLGETTMDMVVYAAPAQLRQAEMYERLGRPREAAEHYARFIELWKDADPELRPVVDDARRALARLAGDRAVERGVPVGKR